MPNDTEVVVPISADNKPLKNTLDETTNAIEKESKKWDKAIDESSGNMQKSFAKALDINRLKDWGIQAAKTLVDFGMKCVNAASDLQEVQNVVDTTFGQSAGQIDAWAKTAINQFGLSETKAKQFASTLGAMMKSAGMAGDEVVKISEDLSGLAADMSSFYNMDFDTAFQKIRSGLSGETEPLKALGINMSQANLQAFALEKGISKTLDKMSQGEMTMLRYQYIMQATADAQGDFARTSDGYANSLRLLQSNLQSIQAQIGGVFIDVLANATSTLNNFLTTLNKPKQKTVLDEFAEIDMKTEEKIASMNATAEQASILVGTLEGISSQVINYSQSGNLVTFIESLSGNVTSLDGALTKAQQGDLNGAIDELATHLAQDLGGDPEKWKNLLQAIGNNAGAAIEATKGDSAKTKLFLERVAAGADDLTTDYSTYWKNLLSVLGDNAGAAITALANGTGTGGILSGIAGGANALKEGTGNKWAPFIEALNKLKGSAGVPFTLSGIANALSTNLGGDADKWENLLKAIGDNAGAAIAATKGDTGATKTFLADVAASADDLTTDYSTYWKNLLSALGDNAEEAITSLANGGNVGGIISGIAEGANDLKAGTSFVWSAFIASMNKLKGSEGVPATLSGIADALSKKLGGESDKWENLLKAVGNNAGAAIEATKGDTGKTKSFLEGVAESADDLSTDYSTYWNSLLSALGDNAGAAIQALANGNLTGGIMEGIAKGANELNAGTSFNWGLFVTSLNGLKGSEEVPATLQGIASAFAQQLGGDASKWENLLKAIGNNAGAAIGAVKGDEGKTKEFLQSVAEGADDLTTDYSTYWTNLLKALGDNAEAAITGLANANNPGNIISGIATGANKLLATSPFVWSSLLNALTKVNGLSNIFSNNNAGKNVADLAKALSGNSPDTTKAEAWKTFLSALSENPEALTTLTKTDAEETAGWLSTMAQAVNEIEPGDANAWSNLFTYFVQGLPGLNDSEGGHAFFESIAQEFLAMGSESEQAKAGLAALGLSTDQIDTAQKEWLETCKQLVQTIPGLSEIINTQTGEVKGGKQAIEEYYKTWQQEQEKQLLWDAYYQKQRVLIERKADEYKYKLDYLTAQARYNEIAKRFNELGGQERINELDTSQYAGWSQYKFTEEDMKLFEVEKQLRDAEQELISTSKAYNDEIKNNKAAEEDLQLTHDALIQQVGEIDKSMQGANDSADGLANGYGNLKDKADEVTKAIDETEKAVKALKDYADQAYESSLKSVQGTLGGFNRVLTPMDQAKQKVSDLTKQLNEFNGDDANEKNRLTILLEDAKNAVPSIQNLNEALDSQIKFLSDYFNNLEEMRRLGYSEDVIAMVSGGTAEDAGYAQALVNTVAGDKRIQQINTKVAQIKESSKGLASALTENKLAVDDEFKELEQTVADAVAGLDKYTEAKDNINNTMKGILDGLGDNAESVRLQVQNILDMLAQLSGASYSVNIPGVNVNVAGLSSSVSGMTPIHVHSTLSVDGKQVAKSVSTHQAEQLTQYNRSGGAFG